MTLLIGLPESPDVRVRSFPLLISFHHDSPCSYITWGMNNRPVGGSISETSPHPIDMIIMMMKVHIVYLRSGVLMAVKMLIVIFRVVMPCGFADCYQYSSEMVITTYKTIRHYNPEDCDRYT
jgi:hypothetical protein